MDLRLSTCSSAQPSVGCPVVWARYLVVKITEICGRSLFRVEMEKEEKVRERERERERKGAREKEKS